MVIRKELTDILKAIAPEVYGSMVVKDKSGVKLLFVPVLKALYGLMEVSLILYEKNLKDLQEMVFKINIDYPMWLIR